MIGKRTKWPVLLATCTSLVGCAPTRPVEGPVRLGQTAFVDGPKVRPDRIVEDSRCPAGTQCIWAGRLVVRATVSGGAWSKVMDLTLGTPVAVADGMLTLVAAIPDRQPEGRAPKPSRYRFTFRFQGGR